VIAAKTILLGLQLVKERSFNKITPTLHLLLRKNKINDVIKKKKLFSSITFCFATSKVGYTVQCLSMQIVMNKCFLNPRKKAWFPKA